ncbi:hypothetical protein F5H01DRAFT_318283 [Linnemannia elongata]|nr:hypothetical protein F5H01DRAFT_318283 [Linnemannia elongata]
MLTFWWVRPLLTLAHGRKWRSGGGTAGSQDQGPPLSSFVFLYSVCSDKRLEAMASWCCVVVERSLEPRSQGDHAMVFCSPQPVNQWEIGKDLNDASYRSPSTSSPPSTPWWTSL